MNALPDIASESGPGNRELSLSGSQAAEILGAIVSRGASFRIRVAGCSMLPFIRHDDLVTVASAGPGAIGFGDIVAFRQTPTGRLVLHRVVGRGAAGLVVRGDGSWDGHDSVAPEAVLGCVTRVERSGRRVRLGLGPERRLVALLARLGILPGLVSVLRLGRRCVARVIDRSVA